MLVSNPREWARAAVGSWWRFAFMAICLVVIQVEAVLAAHNSGLLSSVLMSALMPTMFQGMLLYALRRLYRQASGEEASDVLS